MKFFLLAFGCLASFTLISGTKERLSLHLPDHNTIPCVNWSISPHPSDCHKFLACVNTIAEEYTCAPNHHFDKREGRCVLGSCVNENPECREHTVQRVEGDCTSFKFCLDGIFQQFPCAPGYYFDAALSVCVQIDNSPQHKCSCILPDFAVLPSKDDCKSYHVCSQGSVLLQECPRGQYYDERVNVCLPDLKGVCLAVPTMNPREQAMLSACEEASKKGEIFVGATSGDCREFYMCVNGKVFSKQCEQGFYFDKENNYCVADTTGKCKQQEQEADQLPTTHHYYQGFRRTTVTTPEPAPVPEKKPAKRPGFLKLPSHLKKKKELAAQVAPIVEHEESVQPVELHLTAELHLQQQPSATNSQYDKVSSKFITF